MMFGKTCSNCGQENPRQAAYCSNCGVALSGGTRRCGKCGTENRGDARFCKKCGAALDVSEAPGLYNNRWVRGEKEFAVRLEVKDLKGLLKRGLVVEPGTNALLIEGGVNRGSLPPGSYTLETLPQRVSSWLTGDVSGSVTVLLVEVVPTEFVFNLGGIFTSDPVKLGLSVRLQVEVNEPGKFLINLLKGQERFTSEHLRQYLYPEVVQIAEAWVRRHSIQQLAEDMSLRPEFELELEEALKTTFAQSGLRFLQVRTMEFNMEHLDHIKGIHSKYYLQIAEAEAQAKGKTRLADVMSEINLQELAEETRKVELEERKAGLYQRMREAVMSDRMNEVRSEADFEAFLDEQDRQKLLREKERNELLRGWQEESEDHERARAFLLSKLEVEQKYQLRLMEIRLQSEHDSEKLDAEIDLARRRADYEFEMKRKTAEQEVYLERERLRIETEKRKAQLEFDRMEGQQEREDTEWSLQILAKMKEIKRLDEEERLRIQRVHEVEKAKAFQALELEKWEAQERYRITEREHEIKKMQELANLSTEALISISSVEQGRILADIKHTEALKGMTEDQILAMAAEKSPQVAAAFQEKYRAIAQGQLNEREHEMYERLLKERDQSLERFLMESEKRSKEVSGAWEKSSLQNKEMTERALDRLSDTAQAFARGSGGQQPTVIVSSPGGPQVIPMGNMDASMQMGSNQFKTCTNCGRQVDINSHHCMHCGHKFEGV